MLNFPQAGMGHYEALADVCTVELECCQWLSEGPTGSPSRQWGSDGTATGTGSVPSHWQLQLKLSCCVSSDYDLKCSSCQWLFPP